MYEKESIDYKGMTVKIYFDENPESPREWDNLGTIYSNHRDYSPDKHKIEELCDEDGELNKKELDRYFIWLPVYAYIHSGITISTGRGYPFNDRWDSGLFGIIAVSKANVRKEFGWKNITKARLEQIEGYLRGEVKTLDDYYTGNVYGYVVEDEDGCAIESCWGYFGDESIEEMIEEGKGAIDCEIERREEEARKLFMEALKGHLAKRKAQIKSHAPLYARPAFAC